MGSPIYGTPREKYPAAMILRAMVDLIVRAVAPGVTSGAIAARWMGEWEISGKSSTIFYIYIFTYVYVYTIVFIYIYTFFVYFFTYLFIYFFIFLFRFDLKFHDHLLSLRDI